MEEDDIAEKIVNWFFRCIPIGIIIAIIGSIINNLSVVTIGVILSGFAMLILVHFASKELGWFKDRVPVTYPKEKKIIINNKEIRYYPYKPEKVIYSYEEEEDDDYEDDEDDDYEEEDDEEEEEEEEPIDWLNPTGIKFI